MYIYSFNLGFCTYLCNDAKIFWARYSACWSTSDVESNFWDNLGIISVFAYSVLKAYYWMWFWQATKIAILLFNLGAPKGLGEIPSLGYSFSPAHFLVSMGEFHSRYVLINLNYSKTNTWYLSQCKSNCSVNVLKEYAKDFSCLPWHMFKIAVPASNGKILYSGTEGRGML